MSSISLSDNKKGGDIIKDSNPTPPNTMAYEIYKIEWNAKLEDFSLDYDYLVDLTDTLIKVQDIWPDAPHLELFNTFVDLAEDEMKELIIPSGIEPEELWFRIQRTLALLGLQLHPIRWIIFSCAWCYVYACHIGDW